MKVAGLSTQHLRRALSRPDSAVGLTGGPGVWMTDLVGGAFAAATALLGRHTREVQTWAAKAPASVGFVYCCRSQSTAASSRDDYGLSITIHPARSLATSETGLLAMATSRCASFVVSNQTGGGSPGGNVFATA